MNEVKIFENQEFGSVRTVVNGDKVLFCGSDVAKVLGYARPNDAINQHCKGDAVFCRIIDSLGREQEARFITEGDVYRLIAHSKLPAAQKFESWVFDEVLPTIRKTGSYVPQSFAEALKLAYEQQLKIEQQSKEIKALQPKADYFDDLVERNLLTNFRDTAKEFNMNQKVFINWLMDNHYIFRDNKGQLKPYNEHVVNDLFNIKEWKTKDSTGIQTLITCKGKETFRLLIK